MKPEHSFTSRETFDQYFSEYFSDLTRISQGLAKKWFRFFDDLADDPATAGQMLLNDAYVEAASHPCHFDPTYTCFRSWFVGIMYHLLSKQYHTVLQKRWHQLPVDTLPCTEERFLESNDLDALLFWASDNPEDHYILQEQAEWFLSFLTAQDQTIVNLYIFEDLQGPVIAQRLHWSPNQVHTRLYKIFRRLRSIAHERLKDWEWNNETLPESSNKREKNCSSVS